MKVLVDLKWYFKQEWKRYSAGVVFLIFVAFLEMIPPKLIGHVVDNMQSGELGGRQLMNIILILVGIGVALYVFRFVWRVFIFGAAVKLGKQLRSDLYRHFTKMDATFYQKHRTGDLMAHATNDINAVQQTAGMGVLTLVDALTIGSFVLATMVFTINWKLTIIALLPMPLMAVATKIYGKMLHTRFMVAQEAFSSLNDKVQESMSGIRVLKAFGQVEQDIESFRKQSKDVVEKNMRVARIDSLFDPTISLVVGFSFLLSVSFGAYFVSNGEMTLGDLLAFTTYLGLLVWPMLAFGFLFNIMERGHVSYGRIQRLLHTKSEVKDEGGQQEKIVDCSLTVDIESFTYGGNNPFSLSNVHVQLEKGKTLAVVGRTGSGKTTLLKLLLREYDHYHGEISIGNKNIRTYSLNQYYEQYGYVPQDHFLFSATVGENISFGQPTASQGEIEEAATMACIHEDILQFTDGYDTVVGERGVSLSGGQKQRISIARALILNPSILILDDCLSAVDAKTEEEILNHLRKDREGKSTIITAHRLSAVTHADWILVLDEGKVIQEGTHDALIEQEGWYKETYELQLLEEAVS